MGEVGSGIVRGSVTNWYKQNIGDYLRKTVHLTFLQDAAFRRMLDEYYLHEKPLPLDRKLIYARVRAAIQEERWAVDSVLEEFFKESKRGFVNKRAEEEITSYHSMANSARVNGLRGGRPKTNPVTSGFTSGSLGVNSEKLEARTKNQEETSKAKHAPQGGKTGWPTSFELSAQMRSFAIDRGVANPDAEFEAFSDHHQAKGSKFSKWEAAWRTWCRNSERFRGSNGSRQSVAAGGARTESFDERRRRESEAVLSEVGARARAVVSEMEQRVPDSRAKQITNGDLPRSAR